MASNSLPQSEPDTFHPVLAIREMNLTAEVRWSDLSDFTHDYSTGENDDTNASCDTGCLSV
jgi:hypothetical protein